ncbi:uncharacterized protein LOC143041628 [Oratosquilla oratoria]|uniref:uncharacterized protein LOC143041628 n=1 Tax=Oratosquilla oratoria TaxID=337810 RepID=UPI003F762FDA
MGLNCQYLSKPRHYRKGLEIEVLLDDIQHLEKAGQVKTTPDLQPAILPEANRIRGSYHSKFININHLFTAKELRNNPDITIRRADKTAAFVIINREEYTHKIESILSDTTKYTKITRNPTDFIKKKLNKIITSTNSNIDSPKFPKLRGEYSLGYAFGNIKTHKPENLFRNVNVDRTINFILKRVYHCDDTTPLNIPEKSLRSLLEICTKETLFTCPNGRMYKQIDGVAMGSPLGVLFANFFMGTIETELLVEARPSIYSRYVNNIFVRVRDQRELQNLKKTASSEPPD